MSWREALLDRSIIASFDGSGFERHARRFVHGELDVDLQGKRMLVTGATGGLGLATARALAERGATVLVNSRSPARAQSACDALQQELPAARIEPAAFDISSLAAVRDWAASQAETQLDVLIHNAGVLPAQRTTTAEGLEQTVATNLVGPFALSWALRPALARSPDPRIIWVSSGGMLTQKLDVDATFDPPGPFDGVVAYARTKRAEAVLTELLQARMGPRVALSCMHPGWADTPGVERSLPRFWRWMRHRLRTPAQGADTTVWLAARQPRPEPLGAFWFDRAPADAHPLPGTGTRRAEARRLWARLCAAAKLATDADWSLPQNSGPAPG